MAAFMGYNGLSIDDSVVCDIFLRTVDIFTAVIKVATHSLTHSLTHLLTYLPIQGFIQHY